MIKKMKVYRLNDEVINIGEWDLKKITQTIDQRILTEEYILEMENRGLDPSVIYDENFEPVKVSTNPIPGGVYVSEEDVEVRDDGSIVCCSEYRKLRKYPSVEEQLDYIYHNGIEAWKTSMITPIKDEYPKPS